MISYRSTTYPTASAPVYALRSVTRGAVPAARTVPALAMALGAILGAAAGCSTEDRTDHAELVGLVVAPDREPAKIDMSQAAKNRDELYRAIAMPHHHVAKFLGGHRFSGASSIVTSEAGAEVLRIEDTTAIEYAEGGAMHARLDNSHDYGREMVFVAGTVYVRPRHSKFNKRPPADDDEPRRFADELFGTFASNAELVMHAAELHDRGGAEQAGRKAHRIELTLAPTPGKPPRQKLERRKWRESVTVTKLDGFALLDAETGAPLSGQLDAELSFVRDGRSFQMTLHVTHALTSIGENPTIAAPAEDETVVVANHQLEASERERLLHGIAPPARKAPMPKPVSTPAQESGGAK